MGRDNDFKEMVEAVDKFPVGIFIIMFFAFVIFILTSC